MVVSIRSLQLQAATGGRCTQRSYRSRHCHLRTVAGPIERQHQQQKQHTRPRSAQRLAAGAYLHGSDVSSSKAPTPGGSPAGSPDSSPTGSLSSAEDAATSTSNGVRSSSASTSSGSGGVGPVTRNDYAKFVQFFRSASPYIEGHRARTMVVVIPGEVIMEPGLLQKLMEDICLLHGLGVRLVVVLGAAPQIDAALDEAGMTSTFIGGYRVTDEAALEVAVEEAGRSRTAAERYLSKGPCVPVFRRHVKGDSEMHFGPALNVVSGNYVAAKRRGIMDGTDFGFTGEVRFVIKDAIRKQLDNGNIVLLSNLGFTAAGEVLNCNTYDVGLHAAIELGADKLICLHLDDVAQLDLSAWLPLSDARTMLLARMSDSVCTKSMDAEEAHRQRQKMLQEVLSNSNGSGGVGGSNGSGGGDGKDFMLNLDLWHHQGFPTAVSASVVACTKGVKRAHLVHAAIDGGMLLELYSRDGIGTMISTDFYEGIRRARASDQDAIQALLEPLEKANVLVKRSREELRRLIPNFTVLERETKVMGCALLLPLGATPDGARVAEIGAFCVDPVFRGSGRGDSLLDYVEQDARNRGMNRLVLLTTRTADWFIQRDFVLQGPAYASDLIPAQRRERINPARNSQLYVKDLEQVDGATMSKPGKRIGF